MRLYFLLIALAVFSVGCAGFSGVSGGGAGISASSLSFSPTKINNNQLTKLEFSVENSGDYDIESGQVFLFGLPSDWAIEEGAVSDTFSLFALGNRGGKNLPGEKKDFLWVLRAPPALPRDESFSFEARVRVCYPYKTVVSGKIKVISESQWLEKQPAQNSVDVAQSKGPIRVEVLSTQPLIAETETKLKVRVTNTGDGTITGNDCSAFEANQEEEELESAVMQLNKITIGDSDCTFREDLYLQKGQFKEMLITCNVPPLGDAPEASDYFSIELNYNYYSDRAANVIVMGTAEGGTGVGGTGAGILTLKDLCTKACEENGQKIILSGSKQGDFTELDSALGWCRSKSESADVPYPPAYPQLNYYLGFEEIGKADIPISPYNTGLTMVDGLYPINPTLLEKAIGSQFSKATLKNLNLHDVRIGEIDSETNVFSNAGTLITDGLGKLTLGDIDADGISAQYDSAKLKYDADGDGLPSYWEVLIDPSGSILDPTKKDTDGDTIADGNEKNKDGITYKEAYNADVKAGKNPPTFGIVDYFCKEFPTGQTIGTKGGATVKVAGPRTSSQPCTSGEKSNIVAIQLANLNEISVNGREISPVELKSEKLSGSTITAIDGIPISTIAGKNPSSKIQSISAINVEDFKVPYLTKNYLTKNLQNFLKYTKCDAKYAPAAYDGNVVCKCLRKQEVPLTTYTGTASGECNAFCTKNKFEKGLCASPFDKGYACSGTSLLRITQFTYSAANPLGCTADAPCACSLKLGTLSTTEASIVCGK